MSSFLINTRLNNLSRQVNSINAVTNPMTTDLNMDGKDILNAGTINYTALNPPVSGGSQNIEQVLIVGNDCNGLALDNVGGVNFNDTINEVQVGLATGLGPTLQLKASDGVTPANLVVGALNTGNITASNSVISTTGTGYFVTDRRVNIGDPTGSTSVDLVTSDPSTLNIYQGGTTTLTSVNVSGIATNVINHPTNGLYMTLTNSGGQNRTVLSSDLGFVDTRNAILYARQNSLIGLRVQDNGGVPYLTFNTSTGAGSVELFQPLVIGGMTVGAVASSISTNTTYDMTSVSFRNVSTIEMTTTHTSGGIIVMFSNVQAGRTFKVLLKSLAAGGSVFFSNITIPVTVNKGQQGLLLEFYCALDGTIILMNPPLTTYICRKHLSASQSYGNGVTAIVNFDTTTWSVPNTNWIDTTTNANGFVILESGYYRINLNIQWSSSATNSGRTAQIRLSTDSGSTWNYINQEVGQSSTVLGIPSQDCVAAIQLNVGDWIGANANNGSSGTINIEGGNTINTLGINSFMLIEKLT